MMGTTPKGRAAGCNPGEFTTQESSILSVPIQKVHLRWGKNLFPTTQKRKTKTTKVITTTEEVGGTIMLL
jgi:hypothetical protein